MRALGKMARLGLAAGWMLLASVSLTLAQGAADGEKPATPPAANGAFAPDSNWPWLFVLLIWVIAIWAAILVRNSLGANSTGGQWRLADALSEADTIGTNGAAAAPRLVASSSRLIAFLGLIVMLILFLGFGSIGVLHLLRTGQVPDLDKIAGYFVGGATLFLPYLANQAKEAVSALGPKAPEKPDPTPPPVPSPGSTPEPSPAPAPAPTPPE